MNEDIFVFPKLPKFNNFRMDECDANLSLIGRSIYYSENLFHLDTNFHSMLQNPKLTWGDFRDEIGILVFLTSLAYTFKQTHRRDIAIHPFYIDSLFQVKLLSKWILASRNKRIHNRIKNNEFLSRFIEVKKLGGMEYVNSGKQFYNTTIYSLKDGLIEYSENEMQFDTFNRIILNEDLCNSEGRILSGGEKMYTAFFDSKRFYFNKLKEARLFALENNTEYRKMESSEKMLYHLSQRNLLFQEMDEARDMNEMERVKRGYKEGKRKKALVSKVIVNRNEIFNILSDPVVYNNLSVSTIYELCRVLYCTTRENKEYEIEYYQSDFGRKYSQNCNFQLLPKSLRGRIMDNYTEIDMNCSSYLMMYNMFKKILYEKRTDEKFIKKYALEDAYQSENPTRFLLSEIFEMCSDKRRYRKLFVNENLSYENVKQILTIIGYGCNCDEYHFALLIDGKECKKNSVLAHLGMDNTAILNFISHPKIKKLREEVKLVRSVVMKDRTSEREGKKYIKNYLGNLMEIDKNTSSGRKMAFLIQSMESIITYSLANSKVKEIFEVGFLSEDGNGNANVSDFVGLYLHDGFYVSNDCITSFFNTMNKEGEKELFYSKQAMERKIEENIKKYIRENISIEGFKDIAISYEVNLKNYANN